MTQNARCPSCWSLVLFFLSWWPFPAAAAANADPFIPFEEDTCGCVRPVPRPWKCETFEIAGVPQGAFLFRFAKEARFVVAAPHGWFDSNTDKIVANLTEQATLDPPLREKISRLIAHSFRGNCETGFAYNVNRPSLLNVDQCGLSSSTPGIAAATEVYRRFATLLDDLGQGPQVDFYVEIHGHNESRVGDRIEIATARLSMKETEEIKRIFYAKQNILGRLVRPQGPQGATGPQATVWIPVDIEPLDEVFFGAGRAKECGSIGHVSPAPVLHIELPKSLRTDDQWPETAAYLAAVFSDILQAKAATP